MSDSAAKPPFSSALPLWRRRLVITRPRARASGWVQLFAQAGADVLLFPTVELVNPGEAERDQLLARLVKAAAQNRCWLAITSPSAAEALLNLVEGRSERDCLKQMTIAAVGLETQDILNARGVEIEIGPDYKDSKTLAAAILQVDAKPRVLHVSSNRGRPTLAKLISEAGGQAEAFHVANNRQLEVDRQLLQREWQEQGLDLFTFASLESVNSLCTAIDAAVDGSLAKRLRTTAALAVGEATLEALTEQGFTHIKVAASPRPEHVLAAAVASL